MYLTDSLPASRLARTTHIRSAPAHGITMTQPRPSSAVAVSERTVPMPVAIIDPAPAYRRGLLHILAEAGYLAEDPADAAAWVVRAGPRAALVTIRSPDCFKILHSLAARGPKATVIALLVDATPDRHVEAWRAGADAAVSWDSAPEGIVAVLAAAVDGNTLLPREVAVALTRRIPTPDTRQQISDEEIAWLKALAGGVTVRELADRVGYSERGLYRILCGLYRRLGAATRLEAILRATRLGLLDAS